MYVWDFGVIWQNKEAFFYGLLQTCWLSLVAIILGTVLGVGLVIAGKSGSTIVRFLAARYIDIFRAIPVLALLFWVQYGLPFGGIVIPTFVSALLSLALNGAAFYAENIRAGLEAVPNSQRESALALGMTKAQVTTAVVLPQAIRNMLPNLLNEYITTIKLSSFASAIGVAELINRADSINSINHKPLEIYTAVAFVYLSVILPLTFLVRRMEKRLSAKKGEHDVH